MSSSSGFKQVHARERFTPAQIAELIAYDPATGSLTFKKTGRSALGSVGRSKERVVFNSTATAASSIVHALQTGSWPKGTRVKYRDGDHTNFAWANLIYVEPGAGAKPQNTKRYEVPTKDRVLDLLMSDTTKKWALQDILAALRGLPQGAVSTTMTALRREGKIHISGISDQRFATHGRIAFLVSGGPPPDGWSLANINLNVDEVRRIIREEVLTRPDLTKKTRERAIARMETVESYRVDESGLVPAPEEDEEAWHKDVLSRSRQIMERTLQELRRTRVPVSVFSLAQHGSP